MRIDAISQSIQPVTTGATVPAEQGGQSFGRTIKEALSGVNKLQTDADDVATRFAQGDAVEIHQAMIAMQKASTALQFTIQVRNKIIEAYQEIMRMQV
ncbi:MAG: flagellar hook-basal body complex protein FliE [Coriobacteriia bacterium]|nr:flagellar hook-basal body complex protein FliE [Coriobacteriia bacterium]